MVSSSSLPRHANSGTVIGRASAMGPLFRKLTDIIGDNNYPHKGDQGERSSRTRFLTE